MRFFFVLAVYAAGSSHALAQQEEPFPDTTLIDSIIESPAAEPSQDSDNEDMAANFLKKDEQRAGDTVMAIRRFPAGYVDSVKKREAYWYADYDFTDKKKSVVYNNDGYPVSDSAKGKKGDTRDRYKEGRIRLGDGSRTERPAWLSALIWMVLIGGFIAILVWILGTGETAFFGRKKVQIGDDGHEEEVPDNIFEINYDREIARAEKEGNYRFAIRLHFLRLLRDMSNRNIITYRQNKTNFDYLADLHSSGYYPSFFTIVRHYEYAWYGKFFISDDQYAVVKQEVAAFHKQGGLV